jgi:hypothetical protein
VEQVVARVDAVEEEEEARPEDGEDHHSAAWLGRQDPAQHVGRRDVRHRGRVRLSADPGPSHHGSYHDEVSESEKIKSISLFFILKYTKVSESHRYLVKLINQSHNKKIYIYLIAI